MNEKQPRNHAGPPRAVLRTLELTARRRRFFTEPPPADEEEAVVAARGQALLDEVEEIACEEGARAPGLARLWRQHDRIKARMTQLRAVAPPAAAPPAAAPPPPVHQPPPGAHHPPGALERPLTEGDPHVIDNAIANLRTVARRAAADPQPPGGATRPPFTDLLPRLTALITGLFAAGLPEGNLLRIVGQVLATFLPLLGAGEPPAGPRRIGEPTAQSQARIDYLLQERATRARARQAAAAVAAARARPDIPPAARTGPDPAPAEAADAGLWHDLLDLTSEALEAFIGHGDARGLGTCAELLDLLAETFAHDRPEAA